MAKRKVIAIAFSDLHLNMWSKFNHDNHRTLNGFDVIYRIANICHHKRCPALFCGDLLHKPENIEHGLYRILINEFHRLDIDYPNFRCFAITGNHDTELVNHIEKPVSSWVSEFSKQFNWLVCVDCLEFQLGRFRVLGIPYVDHNVGLNTFIKNRKDDILMLHTDYPGAKDTDGRPIDSVENLNINLLKPFKLVLCGHIHKSQRLGKKVYMVGAPQQQRRTDRNCKMGYLEIYNDLSVKFRYWDDYPKFIDVYDESEIKDDGNYYTVIPKPTSKVLESEHKITKQLTKRQLARRYMKQKGDKNKGRLKLLTHVLTKGEKLC